MTGLDYSCFRQTGELGAHELELHRTETLVLGGG